jgi:hypothetical protein
MYLEKKNISRAWPFIEYLPFVNYSIVSSRVNELQPLKPFSGVWPGL